MAKQNHNLPEVLIPEGDICVPLFIPAHPDYVSLMVRAIRMLTLDRHYDRDPEHSAIIVRKQWSTRTYQPFIDSLANGTTCCDDNNDSCFKLDNTTDAVRFYPNDPFAVSLSDDYNALGQWYRWSWLRDNSPPPVQNLLDLTQDLTFFDLNIGYFPIDAILLPDLPQNPIQSIFGGIDSLASFDFPYVEIKLVGSGELELELLNTPKGGSAVIMWDFSEFNIATVIQELTDQTFSGEPNIIFTELQRNITQIPPETLERNSVEIQLDGDENTEHVVRVYFVPSINYTDFTFIGFGGGMRSITVCDNLVVTGATSGDEINIRNHGTDLITREGIIGVTLQNGQICEEILCAFEKISQRILLGENSNNILSGISIDKETGEVTIDIPQDNSFSVSAEIEQSKFGGHYRQAKGIKDLIDQTQNLRTLSWSLSAITNATQTLINPLNPSNWSSLISDFTGTGSAVVITIDVQTLAEYLYCSDIGNAVINYAINEGFNESETEYLSRFVQEIPSTTFAEWYAEGKRSPREGYDNTSCYAFPKIDFVLTGDDINDNGGSIVLPTIDSWSTRRSNRNYLFEFSGWIYDTVNNWVWDGIWFNNDGTLDERYSLVILDGSVEQKVVAQPSYITKSNPNIVTFGETYKVIYEPIDIDNWSLDNSISGSVNWIGEIRWSITDLGLR